MKLTIYYLYLLFTIIKYQKTHIYTKIFNIFNYLMLYSLNLALISNEKVIKKFKIKTQFIFMYNKKI